MAFNHSKTSIPTTSKIEQSFTKYYDITSSVDGLTTYQKSFPMVVCHNNIKKREKVKVTQEGVYKIKSALPKSLKFCPWYANCHSMFSLSFKLL